MRNISIVTIVFLMAGLIAGFLGGMKYQSGKVSNSQTAGSQAGSNGGRGNGGAGQRQGGRGGARPTAGEIISLDDKSITVKLNDGSSKIILFSDKTQINKASTASKNDLKNGTRVAVFGTDNSDGSVTAQNISINPQFGGMGANGGGKTPNQNPKSSDAKEIVIEGSNYKFNPDKITVKKGEKTRILLKNTEGVHDFRVDELNLSTAIVRSQEEDFVEYTPDKTGQYEFYCSVDGHRQMGMKGILTVE